MNSKPHGLSPPTDPPMEPYAGSVRWFETGPEPILDDPDCATLIVRVGMASNALIAQFQAGSGARRHRYLGARTRDILWSFVTAAAFTNEAIRLAQENLLTLRVLATLGGAPADLLYRVGQLCAGKHASANVLKRARNQVGFHWDKEVVRPSVTAYGKNKRIMWSESDTRYQPIHRLAIDVLSHALFPDAAKHTDPEKAQQAVSVSMDHVDDAMQVVVEFFIASTLGYLKKCNAGRKEARMRSPSEGRGFKRQRRRR